MWPHPFELCYGVLNAAVVGIETPVPADLQIWLAHTSGTKACFNCQGVPGTASQTLNCSRKRLAQSRT